MKKKVFLLTLAVLVLIIGWFFTGMYAFGSQGTYYGFISCMQREKLNYFHEFLIFELLLFVFFLLLGLRHIYFLPFKNRTVLHYIIALILINLVSIAYIVIEYPVVVRRYGFLSATGEGTIRNPFFVFSLLHAVVFAVYVLVFLKNVMSSKLRWILFIIGLSAIIAEIIVILSTKIKPCFG